MRDDGRFTNTCHYLVFVLDYNRTCAYTGYTYTQIIHRYKRADTVCTCVCVCMCVCAPVCVCVCMHCVHACVNDHMMEFV